MTTTENLRMPVPRSLRVGDWVEVRSEAEILATLDDRGELDELPCMPEMLAYRGRRLRVAKVAHKVCDNIARTGLHRMERAVHLTDARCDGSGHGGCQNACLLFWKEAWLRRVEPAEPADPVEPSGSPPAGRALLPLVAVAATREPAVDGAVRYSCQATEMRRAAPGALPVRDLDQYVQDVRSGNVGVLAALRGFLIVLFNRLQAWSTRTLPESLWFRGGARWGFLHGRVLTGRTPPGELGLRPGELVRIRSKQAIEATLNADLQNRGMGFDPEMSRFCGRVARVRRRVDRVIDEKTGRMLTMKYPCIVLEGIVCEGAFSGNCPRAFVAFWREIWLERVEEPAG
jgi:hypothetical protein